MAATSTSPTAQDVQAFREALLADYQLMCVSREASLGRKEMLTGKAKFGIFGDGKETSGGARWCERAIGGRGTTEIKPS